MTPATKLGWLLFLLLLHNYSCAEGSLTHYSRICICIVLPQVDLIRSVIFEGHLLVWICGNQVPRNLSHLQLPGVSLRQAVGHTNGFKCFRSSTIYPEYANTVWAYIEKHQQLYQMNWNSGAGVYCIHRNVTCKNILHCEVLLFRNLANKSCPFPGYSIPLSAFCPNRQHSVSILWAVRKLSHYWATLGFCVGVEFLPPFSHLTNNFCVSSNIVGSPKHIETPVLIPNFGQISSGTTRAHF